jgi:hypothetical protein
LAAGGFDRTTVEVFLADIHRLAAGGYDRTTVEIFLATSTAWQRVATIGRRWIELLTAVELSR